MALIDVGVDFSMAQAEAEKSMKPAAKGVYELQVSNVELGETKEGNPRLMFKIEIVNSPNPDYNGKGMTYFANLPHNGQLKGIGYLTQILSALGRPWTGTNGNYQFDTDSLIGLRCRANVGISKDGKWNQIDSFVTM